jgi:hypothetical protein
MKTIIIFGLSGIAGYFAASANSPIYNLTNNLPNGTNIGTGGAAIAGAMVAGVSGFAYWKGYKAAAAGFAIGAAISGYGVYSQNSNATISNS